VKSSIHTLVLAIVCVCSLGANAQSGRKKDLPPTPVPVTTTPPKALLPSPSDKITALIVVGEITHDFAYMKTTSLDWALKECVARLKERPFALTEVTREGKVKYENARERARIETKAHILWLGFTLKAYGISGMRLESIDYAVIIPGTGGILTAGTVTPGKHGVVSTGGVLNIPSNGRTSSSVEMKLGVMEVVDTLKHGGWF
jgi:hypothetical protein